MVTTFTYDGRGRKIRQHTVQSSTQTMVANLEWEFNNLNLITKIAYHHLGMDSSMQ